MNTRRDFIKTAGFGIAAGAMLASGDMANRAHAAGGVASQKAGPRDRIPLALASYTLRKFSLEQALAMCNRVGAEKICLKDMHLPLKSTPEQVAKVLELAKAKNVQVYAAGCVYMKKAEDVDLAFKLAKAAKLEMLVCAPNIELLPLVEKWVKETNVLAAIHNHGPDNPLYPSPLDAYKEIKGMDKRMGLCIDVGHTQRLGQDPIKVFKEVVDRVYDIHMKDVTGSNKAGRGIELGRGVMDIVGLLKAVHEAGYKYALDFEHEKDDGDPLPGIAECVGYVRGVYRALGVV